MMVNFTMIKTQLRLINFHQIFTIFCLIGCLNQLRQVVTIHLNYEHITRLYMEIPRESILPDLVLCFEVAYLLNWSKLVTHQPELVKFIGANETKQWYRMLEEDILTVNDKILSRLRIDQITDLTYEPNQMFDQIHVREKSSKGIYDLCRVRRFFSSNHLCLTFQCNRKKKVRLVYNAKYQKFRENLFNLELNQVIFANIPRVYATLVMINKLPWDIRTTWISMSFGKNSPSYQLDFTILTTLSLPAPFKSNCIDYGKFGFVSRAQAIQSCLNHESIHILGCPFHSNNVEIDLDMMSGYSMYRANQHNQSYVKLVDRMVSECHSKYVPIDCKKTRILTSIQPEKRFSRNHSTVRVNENKGPNVEVILEPASTLIELFISINSIVSTWFGFSLAARTQGIMSTSKSFINKRFFNFTSKSKFKVLSTEKSKKFHSKDQLIFVLTDHSKRPYILAYQGEHTNQLIVPKFIYTSPKHVPSKMLN